MRPIETFANIPDALTTIRPEDITGLREDTGGCVIEIVRTVYVRASMLAMMRALATPPAPAPSAFAQAPLAEGLPEPAATVDADTRGAEERMADIRANRAKKQAFYIKAGARFATPSESWTTQAREAARFDNRAEADMSLAEWRAGKKPPPDDARVVEDAA